MVAVRRNVLTVAGGAGELMFQLRSLDGLGKYLLSGTNEEKDSPKACPISFSGSLGRTDGFLGGGFLGCVNADRID